MIEHISLRDVSNEQIYDSYMGILRISPSDIDGSVVDSMSLALTNPLESSGAERKIILSDSDGIKMGLYFTLKVRATDVVNSQGRTEKQNVINAVINTDANLFVSKTFNNRSTLITNSPAQGGKISSLQIYHENSSSPGVYDILTYPIASPHNSTYFNTNNKLGLIDYNNSKNVHVQLDEALYNKSKDWYDKNISEEHRVKVGGKYVYRQNKDNEQVPVLYTKDYVLGQNIGQTARITQDIITKFIGTSIGPERLQPQQSIFTKLSYVEIDKLVWDIVHEITQGTIRHSEGRYSMLGVGENESITHRLFGYTNPPTQYSPILGTGVSPGIVMTHAMPFRRFIFHVLRQEVRNSLEENNNYANLRSGVKDYISAKKITPISKLDPGFVNVLTKEFVLCDGKELNYNNYPSVNTDNPNLFQHDALGQVLRDNTTKKPLVSTTKSDLYNALSKSNVKNNNGTKVMVPSLLAMNQQSPRYLRGMNWFTNNGVNSPIDFESSTLNFDYAPNTRKHEVVKDSDYGLAEKNFPDPGVYRMQVDWKATELRHKHLCFYNSESYNRTNTTGHSFGNILEAPYYRRQYVLQKGTAPMYTIPFTPMYFSVLNPGKYTEQLMDYSFSANTSSADGELVPNSWEQHQPIPFAGLFAWKIGDDGNMANNTVKSNYVIQNENQTPISTDSAKRKNQLEQINYSEGAVPVAAKGGTQRANYGSYGINCYRRKKTGKHNRYRQGVEGHYTGGYIIQKETEESVQDVPRCVTSLPHQHLDSEKIEHVDPYTMTVGGQKLTPDMTLSFPPTTILLPLFKI